MYFDDDLPSVNLARVNDCFDLKIGTDLLVKVVMISVIFREKNK